MIIRVEPTYGNGWIFAATGQLRDTPSPFDLNLAPTQTRIGIIVTLGHEFEGALATLTPRHIEPDNQFNIEVTRGAAALAIGYARLP